jgi:alpha-D-ribose 1-methylphosphonate 5-triphosphate diphosphatase PhnM
MIISAPRLFVDGAFRGPGAVRVLGGRVAEVLAGPGPADVALESGFLAPGLIDLRLGWISRPPRPRNLPIVWSGWLLAG